MLIIEVWFFVIAGQFVQQGLEYRIVFVMDSNEGITPHRRAAFEKDMEKERRLFYVVMTRTKELLYLFS
jgi:ATP-dependent DNA helicase pcrA